MTAGTVTLLLFARYAELLGQTRVHLPIGPGETVGSLVARVRAELPGASALPPAPLVAVNRSQAGAGAPVAPGDEVALLPPLAGG